MGKFPKMFEKIISYYINVPIPSILSLQMETEREKVLMKANPMRKGVSALALTNECNLQRNYLRAEIFCDSV